jgi:hypothetical protein
MATKVNGNTYHLRDDCETLICKLDNLAYEKFMEGDYDASIKYETDRDDLEIAVDKNDREAMQAIIENYRGLFKRYR